MQSGSFKLLSARDSPPRVELRYGRRLIRAVNPSARLSRPQSIISLSRRTGLGISRALPFTLPILSRDVVLVLLSLLSDPQARSHDIHFLRHFTVTVQLSLARIHMEKITVLKSWQYPSVLSARARLCSARLCFALLRPAYLPSFSPSTQSSHLRSVVAGIRIHML